MRITDTVKSLRVRSLHTSVLSIHRGSLDSLAAPYFRKLALAHSAHQPSSSTSTAFRGPPTSTRRHTYAWPSSVPLFAANVELRTTCSACPTTPAISQVCPNQLVIVTFKY